MSAERFLDDLARTLAEPMPRRRAVRLLGVSLAATMVPGVAPRLARAAPTSPTQVTCRGDRRTCQKGAEASFEKYCCPAPSWRHLCGSQSNAYGCINTCTGSKKFPCTALVAHPDSGINGVCCDRNIHSGCIPIGPPAEKRPDGSTVPSQAWKPSCCPKGPGYRVCDDTCCQAPNKCRRGQCRCPNGSVSCDGRNCCKRGESCSLCIRTSTALSESLAEPAADIVGRKCCPTSARFCCGTTCCKKLGCCGTKCCPEPARCAEAGGKSVCCPLPRVTVAGDDFACCPVGTVRSDGGPGNSGSGGCCPPDQPACCGGLGAPLVSCGNKICVRGACVNP